MVKILGRMEEGAAPVAPSTSETASNGFKVLGRMGEATKDQIQSSVSGAGEAVMSGAASLENIASSGLSAAKEFVQGAGEVVSSGIESAKPNLQSAADFAKESLDFTAKTITEAATVEPETLTKALLFAAPVASKVLPINAAKFAEFLGNNGKINMSAEELGPDAEFLRDAAIRTIESGESAFSYKTWGFEDKSILMSDLPTTAAMSLSDPNYRMATLIGRTGDGNVRVENGRIIVEDVYDFNSGPRGKKLQQALALKETGDMEGYESLAEEALVDLPYFAQMRVWAAALGVPQGEGTRYKLDLGPAPGGLKGKK